MRFKNLIILFLIIFLASILRFYHLSIVPPSLDWDEASLGWNAYAIFKTGTDEYGKAWPVSIRSFNDYKPPLYVYATIPSVAIFGLNEFSVRFPSALAGIFTVLTVYFLITQLAGSTKLAQLTSLLLAISPWNIQFSRAAFEANLALFFFVLGVLFLVKFIHKPSFVSCILYVVSFVLSIYSYHSSRLVIPIFLFAVVVFYRTIFIKNLKLFIVGCLLFVSLLYPLIRNTIHTGSVSARLTEVSAFAAVLPWDVPTIFAKNYLSHFDFNFLFLSVGANPRHHAPDMGLLYLWQVPFLIAGLYFLIKDKAKYLPLLIIWLASAPVAAAIARDAPHEVRALLLLPVLQIIIAYGLLKSLNQRFFLSCLLCLLISVNVFYYLHQYFIHLPIETAKSWQFGYKEMVRKVVAIEKNYDKIYVTNYYDQPYIYFLFYGRIDPIIKNTGYFYQDFDHYKFGNLAKAGKKDLIVFSPTEQNSNLNIFDQVNFPDGTPAFFFATIKGQ